MNTPIVAQSPVVSSSIAFQFGQEDATTGQLCIPEMWFYRHEDKVAYAAGYASVNGPTMTTRQFLTDAEIEAEAQDYEEDMLDREWHSRGAW
jgi:hypothetical protein